MFQKQNYTKLSLKFQLSYVTFQKLYLKGSNRPQNSNMVLGMLIPRSENKTTTTILS